MTLFQLRLIQYIIDFLHLVHLFKPAIVVLASLSVLLSNAEFEIFAFLENLVVILLKRERFEQNLGFIKCLKANSAESEGIDDGTEFGKIELLSIDDKALFGEVYQNFTECNFSLLLELRNINIVRTGQIFFIDNHKLTTESISACGKVSKLIVVNTHYELYQSKLMQ